MRGGEGVVWTSDQRVTRSRRTPQRRHSETKMSYNHKPSDGVDQMLLCDLRTELRARRVRG